jgi:Mg2+ and Co2+ transporter CorA
MDPELLNALANLSIATISVLSLVYTILQFLKALDNRAERHAEAMAEQQKALRDVEAHVRNMLANSLTQSSIALEQNTRVLSRIIARLDGEK